jgi:cytochrome c biogenesis protein CcmG/thiol:disulfide interchange protein DsbE
MVLTCSFNQTGQKKIIPVELKSLDGNTVNSSSFTNGGKPIILVFWISFHKNPTLELDAIAENYETWKKEIGVKLITIAEDDSKTSSAIVTKVNARGWEYEFYLDTTQEFKRVMNVSDVPCTMIIDGKGKVVWERIGFTEGLENTIYKELKKLL